MVRIKPKTKKWLKPLLVGTGVVGFTTPLATLLGGIIPANPVTGFSVMNITVMTALTAGVVAFLVDMAVERAL